MPKAKALATAPVIQVKRESWKNGLHSVARDKAGHWITSRKWHSKKDTEKVKDYVVLRVSFPEEYKKHISRPKPSLFFKRSGDYPEKYVYIIQNKFKGEIKSYSMTSPELYTMTSNNKDLLMNQTKIAYEKEFEYDDEHFEEMKLMRVYESRMMKTIRKYQ